MINSVSLNSIYHLRYSDWRNTQHDVRTESEANTCQGQSAIFAFPPGKQVTEDMNSPVCQPQRSGPLNSKGSSKMGAICQSSVFSHLSLKRRSSWLALIRQVEKFPYDMTQWSNYSYVCSTSRTLSRIGLRGMTGAYIFFIWLQGPCSCHKSFISMNI